MSNDMERHIIVCTKSVLIRAPADRAVRSSDSCELNPFDRPALELALRMKNELGGTVTALSMGPASCAFTLHEAMAMGVDRGVLINDPALIGSDTLATSTTLGAAINKLAPFDLILFGARTADSDTGHVGPQTAVALDLPLVTGVCAIEAKDSKLIVERKADGFREHFELHFPAALTIHQSAAEPRDIGLSGLQSAFDEREIMVLSLEDIGLSPQQVGEAGSPTRVLSLSRVDRGRSCEFLSGSAEEQIKELTRRLLETGMIV